MSQVLTAAKQRSFLNIIQDFTTWFVSDARHYQIFFLSIFLGYGVSVLKWEVNEPNIILTFFICLITQATFIAFTTRDYRSLKSALISALSLSLMLKTNSALVILLASFLSIASKFVLKGNGKHFFNPTNFGIITAILLTQNAWISPGQWGNDGIIVFLIGILGLSVLVKVKRLDTALAFLITFCSLSFIRSVLVLGWEMDFFLHQFTSGTLLLFAFFMITDPVSSPSHPIARIIWATLIGVFAFYLANYQFVNGAPLWALFFLSPLTLLLDRIFVHSKFSWL